jgi:hypothetical protein
VTARVVPPQIKAKRTENWEAVYKEIIRRLVNDPDALKFRKVAGFVRGLDKWAKNQTGSDKYPGFSSLRNAIDRLIDEAEKSRSAG